MQMQGARGVCALRALVIEMSDFCHNSLLMLSVKHVLIFVACTKNKHFSIYSRLVYVRTHKIHTHQDSVEGEHSNEKIQETTEENAQSTDSEDSSELKLHHAASNGQLEVKRLIEEENYNPIDKNEHYDTALHCAAENGHLDTVKYFKKRGLNPSCRGWHGHTPLHDAAKNNHLEVAEYLVEGLVDLLCPDKDSYTPLHTACQG